MSMNKILLKNYDCRNIEGKKLSKTIIFLMNIEAHFFEFVIQLLN